MTKFKALALAALVLTVFETSAWADGPRRHRRNHGYIFHHTARVIRVLPPGYRTLVVGSVVYYVHDGTYYVSSPEGYVVTPAPAVVEVKPEIPKEAQPIDSYEIQIPNANGSYTLVVLKKTDRGFLGPQGEFYPEHPTVEQLKQVYAKK